jgi:hypothetical protein
VANGQPSLAYDPVTDLPTYDTVMQSGPIIQGDQVFLVGVDGNLYGFKMNAPDTTKPTIGSATLEGQAQQQPFAFTIATAAADTVQQAPAVADVLHIPGTPPIWVRVDVSDVGCGLEPQGLSILVDGKPVTDQFYYDSEAGDLYWVYDPPGTAQVNLPAGMHELTIHATDWAQNVAESVMYFDVDNALDAPVVPQTGFGGGGFGGFGGGGGGQGGFGGGGGFGAPAAPQATPPANGGQGAVVPPNQTSAASIWLALTLDQQSQVKAKVQELRQAGKTQDEIMAAVVQMVKGWGIAVPGT